MPDRDTGEMYLKRWYFWATHSRIDPMIKAAKTIKRHWEGVLSWFDSHLTNALLEGMNSLIQAAEEPSPRLPKQSKLHRYGLPYRGKTGV